LPTETKVPLHDGVHLGESLSFGSPGRLALLRRTTTAQPRSMTDDGAGMLFFFSNRIGCLGSIIVSVVLSLIVLAFLGVV
jgi:hypothetical protein